MKLFKFKFNLFLLGAYIADEDIYNNIINFQYSKLSFCRILLFYQIHVHKDKQKCYGIINKLYHKRLILENIILISNKMCFYYFANLPIYADLHHLSVMYIIFILVIFFLIKLKYY